MFDILLFGSGYRGHKRVTRQREGIVDFPSHPILSEANPVIQNIVLPFEISVFWSHVDGRDYLIGIHDANPISEEILDAIFRERPNPLPPE